MSDSFEMQRRYFTAQLEKYRLNPSLHAAAIRDCEYYLDMLEECGSTEAFRQKIQQTGNMLSAGKASAVDRFRNRVSVYHALGHHEKAGEDRDRIAAVEAAGSHAELSTMLTEFEENSSRALQENKALSALGSVFSALFQLCTDGAGSSDRERNIALFKEYWRQLSTADPSVNWERIMTHKPYRDRLPFTDFQMSFLKGVFMEVCNG